MKKEFKRRHVCVLVLKIAQVSFDIFHLRGFYVILRCKSICRIDAVHIATSTTLDYKSRRPLRIFLFSFQRNK